MRRHPKLSSLGLATTNRFQRGEVQFCKPLLEVVISMAPDIGQLVPGSMDAQLLGLKTGLFQNW